MVANDVSEAGILQVSNLGGVNLFMELTDITIIAICHKADGRPLPQPDYLNSRDAICGLWEKQSDDDISWGLGLIGIGSITIRDTVMPTARTYATKFAEWNLKQREIALKHKEQFAAMSKEELHELSLINPPAFAKAMRNINSL